MHSSCSGGYWLFSLFIVFFLTCAMSAGQFVRSMVVNNIDAAMVKSMHEIGHTLGIKAVAEYVEDADIISKLRDIEVDYAQGYQIGQPVPIDDISIDDIFKFLLAG